MNINERWSRIAGVELPDMTERLDEGKTGKKIIKWLDLLKAKLKEAHDAFPKSATEQDHEILDKVFSKIAQLEDEIFSAKDLYED